MMEVEDEVLVTDSEEDDDEVDATYRPGAKLANERKSSRKRKRRKGKFEYLRSNIHRNNQLFYASFKTL